MSAVYVGRRQKYAAKRCDCGRHASLKEHRRYQELVLLERAGEIRNLREQVVFELAPAVVLNGRKKPALRYVADFVYEEQRAECPFAEPEKWGCKEWCEGCWPQVIEDCKGVETPVFRLKLHLMAVKGLEVRLS